MTFATNTINPSLYKTLPFDFQRDIAPVSGLADLPLVLVVNKDVPVKNVSEFVAYAKADPGKITFASFGAKTISHLAIELLRTATGIDYVHVPYPGGPQIITDMVSGRIQAGMDALPNSLPHIRSGAVRALAIMSARRNPAVPDVPAIGETMSGLEINAGTGIGVPAATPIDIVERLNRDINASLADPTLVARYADVGAVPIILTPGEARARIASDIEKWRKVIEGAGLKPE
jgi:tripartite-type tricarboxylate transporter receptor subunit TctC